MEENNQHPYDDEVSLKELILKGQEYARYLWTKKWWIILAGLIGAGIGFYRAYTTPVTYTAELTFMVNEDDGSKIGGVGAILGQFGLGGGSASEYNLDKVAALSKSRRIIQSALFDSINLNGKPDLTANHLIRILESNKKWEEFRHGEFSNFRYLHNRVDDFNHTEKIILKNLYKRIVGDNPYVAMLTVSYKEETGILKMTTTSEEEKFTIELIEKIYSSLSEFYVLQSTENQRSVVTKLTVKADSIQDLIQKTEYRLANFKDRSTSIYIQSELIKSNKLNRDLQILTIIYGETIKNLETAKFVLNSSTPFFQVVDEALEPLNVEEKGTLMKVIVGCILLLSLSVIVFVTMKIYLDVMEN